MTPRESLTGHCKHCRASETMDDQDDAYRTARLHTITVHGVHDYTPTIEHHQETA